MKNEYREYIGRNVQAGGKLKRITGIIIDVEIEDEQEWYKVYQEDGTISRWDLNELEFIEPSPKRNETWDEKVNSLMKSTGKSKEECENFIGFICDFLSSCGYFHSDYNIHGILPKDFPKYRDKCLGTWLLDFALQYNMENGLEYYCKYIRDRKNEHDCGIK